MYSVDDVALQGEHLLGLVLFQPSDLAGQATDLSAPSVSRLRHQRRTAPSRMTTATTMIRITRADSTDTGFSSD
jgi:hypothetical protein